MQLSLKEARSGKWFFVVMGMFTQVGPLLIYLAGGLIMMKTDPALTVGTITATVALINRLYRPVQSLLDIEVLSSPASSIILTARSPSSLPKTVLRRSLRRRTSSTNTSSFTIPRTSPCSPM